MKLFAIASVPLLLTGLCIVIPEFHSGNKINRLQTGFTVSVPPVSSIKHENTGSGQFQDQFATINEKDQDYILLNKNIIVWIP